MADVVCLGILVADIFGNPIASLPAAGELALLDRYLLSVGGCAANTAADLGRLGRSTSVLGKVGNDLFGELSLCLEPGALNQPMTRSTTPYPLLEKGGEFPTPLLS